MVAANHDAHGPAEPAASQLARPQMGPNLRLPAAATLRFAELTVEIAAFALRVP